MGLAFPAPGPCELRGKEISELANWRVTFVGLASNLCELPCDFPTFVGLMTVVVKILAKFPSMFSKISCRCFDGNTQRELTEHPQKKGLMPMDRPGHAEPPPRTSRSTPFLLKGRVKPRRGVPFSLCHKDLPRQKNFLIPCICYVYEYLCCTTLRTNYLSCIVFSSLHEREAYMLHRFYGYLYDKFNHKTL